MAVFSLTDSVVTNQDIVSHNLELGQVCITNLFTFGIFITQHFFRSFGLWQQKTSKAFSAISILAASFTSGMLLAGLSSTGDKKRRMESLILDIHKSSFKLTFFQAYLSDFYHLAKYCLFLNNCLNEYFT